MKNDFKKLDVFEEVQESVNICENNNNSKHIKELDEDNKFKKLCEQYKRSKTLNEEYKEYDEDENSHLMEFIKRPQVPELCHSSNFSFINYSLFDSFCEKAGLMLCASFPIVSFRKEPIELYIDIKCGDGKYINVLYYSLENDTIQVYKEGFIDFENYRIKFLCFEILQYKTFCSQYSITENTKVIYLDSPRDATDLKEGGEPQKKFDAVMSMIINHYKLDYETFIEARKKDKNSAINVNNILKYYYGDEIISDYLRNISIYVLRNTREVYIDLKLKNNDVINILYFSCYDNTIYVDENYYAAKNKDTDLANMIYWIYVLGTGTQLFDIPEDIYTVRVKSKNEKLVVNENNHYNAWSNLNKLIGKGLKIKHNIYNIAFDYNNFSNSKYISIVYDDKTSVHIMKYFIKSHLVVINKDIFESINDNDMNHFVNELLSVVVDYDDLHFKIERNSLV